MTRPKAAPVSRMRTALTSLSGCVLLLSAAMSARAQDSQAARAAYAEGVGAYEQGDNERARTLFSAAEAQYPSPNIELMLGRTLARLERAVEAHQMLSLAVRNARVAPKYASTERAAETELSALEQRLAMLRLRTDALHGDETLRLNGQLVPPRAWHEPIALAPGSVRIELLRPTAEPRIQEFELAAGSGMTLDLSADTPSAPVAQPTPEAPPLAAITTTRIDPPAPDEQQALRTASYILAGVGAAGLATFGIFGTMSRTQFSKLSAACPNADVCNDSNRTYALHGQDYQTAANVALAAGAAVLATGVTLWILTLQDERTTLSLSPHALTLRGSF